MTVYHGVKMVSSGEIMKEEVRQTVRLPRELYGKLQLLADKEQRSINGQIIASLRQTIAQHEREHGPLAGSPDNFQTKS